MPVLEVNNLTKKYRRITAVNNLSFKVEAGMILGILGPNGSGKTTTLGIILNILKANSGTFKWFGGNLGNKARLNIGALLETPNFYPYLNAIDNLSIIAHIKKTANPDIDRLLKLVNLYERRDSKFRTFSLGMKQRLAIAATMVGDPDVLVFDEPTNGLDPQGIAEVRQTIMQIAATGKTIIMASHILDEVEKICSHVAILKKGQMLAFGPIGSIINDDQVIELNSSDNSSILQLLKNQAGVSKIEEEDNLILAYVNESIDAAELNKLAFANGIALSHLFTRKKSLESEFLEITAE